MIIEEKMHGQIKLKFTFNIFSFLLFLLTVDNIVKSRDSDTSNMPDLLTSSWLVLL
jgi:hypothetical protein